jgi:predicted MFS family arabinose efflux permease
VFVALERRVAEPMLPFDFFRRRNLVSANLETLLVYGALGGMFFYFTIYLQFLGFSPSAAGLANVPGSVMMILLSSKFGKLADEHGPRLFLAVGPALIACGLVLFSFMKTKSDFWHFGVAALAVFSLGLSMVVAPITATALSSASPRYSGIASGLNQTVSRLGNLLTVAALGLIVLVVFHSSGGSGDVPLARDRHRHEIRSASTDAFRVAMLTAAGLAFAGAAIGAGGISNREARQSREASPELAGSP